MVVILSVVFCALLVITITSFVVLTIVYPPVYFTVTIVGVVLWFFGKVIFNCTLLVVSIMVDAMLCVCESCCYARKSTTVCAIQCTEEVLAAVPITVAPAPPSPMSKKMPDV